MVARLFRIVFRVSLLTTVAVVAVMVLSLTESHLLVAMVVVGQLGPPDKVVLFTSDISRGVYVVRRGVPSR
jgi:hypothetical protein